MDGHPEDTHDPAPGLGGKPGRAEAGCVSLGERKSQGQLAVPWSSEHSTYLLNRRMAMTMRMMRMTARTGPVTHSISGSSCCWAGVT